MQELWDEAPSRIWIDAEGGIVYDTLFQKKWQSTGLSTDYLHIAIEDNIIPDEDDQDEERIDWYGVQKTFEEMMKGNE